MSLVRHSRTLCDSIKVTRPSKLIQLTGACGQCRTVRAVYGTATGAGDGDGGGNDGGGRKARAADKEGAAQGERGKERSSF